MEQSRKKEVMEQILKSTEDLTIEMREHFYVLRSQGEKNEVGKNKMIKRVKNEQPRRK